MRRAGLPMYDLAELRSATDAFWGAIVSRLHGAGIADVPVALDRTSVPIELWRDPALLFSQTCGYPLARSLRHEVTVVATPIYDVPGCDGPTYRSFVVVRHDAPEQALVELRGAVCAVNESMSHSGMNALRALVAPLALGGRFFAATRITGSHLASLAQITSGEADVAAIDCVTYALAAQHAPALVAQTRILATTTPAPALPYITRDPRLAELLRTTLADLPRANLEPLRIRGFRHVAAPAYDVVLDMERDAALRGYPILA